MTDYRPRELLPLVERALKTFPVVVLSGARQVGKTTFLRKELVFRDRRFLSLDDFSVLEAARRDPEALLTSEIPLTIDEAQRCPELLSVLKKIVDRRRRPGDFLLSGSANFSLLKGLGETLAGRAFYLDMPPLSRREIRGSISEPPFLARLFEEGGVPEGPVTDPIKEEEILRGGMPLVALGEVEDRELWFQGYEQTYLERDIRELSQVGDLVVFRNFLRLAALRNGRLLNRSELARDAKLSVSTVTRYLGLMEASCILKSLPPFLASRAARLIKSPKLFFADSGLAAYLAGVEEIGPSAGEIMRGPLFECYAAQNLWGTVSIHLPRGEMYFWNIQGRYEVDFVIVSRKRAVAVEVKASSRFQESDLKGLKAFLAGNREAIAGILAYNGSEQLMLGERLHLVPLTRLLS